MFRRLSRPRKAGPGLQSPRPAPTGRASAPLDARRRGGQAAGARGTSARGGRHCNIPRPSRTHALLRPPLPESAKRARPADDRTSPARAARAVSRSGHRHPGRPAGCAKPFPPPLTYCAYGATRTRIHSKTGDKRGLLLDTTPPPFVASCFRALALLAEPAKKEEGAQASSPHPFN